jgi:hypothetical protein
VFLCSAIFFLSRQTARLVISATTTFFVRGGFKPVRLKEEFKSFQGIILPKGTIVNLRSCQYGNQVYLPALMEPEFFQSVEPMDSSEQEKPLYSLVPNSGA